MNFQRDDSICFRLFDLCASCKDVLRTHSQGSVVAGMLHHDSQLSMIQAASEHCYVCSIVLADLVSSRGKISTWTDGLRMKTVCSIYANETQSPMIKLEVYPFEPGSPPDNVTKFRLVPCSGINDITRSKTLELGNDTSSPATLDIAMEWYTACCDAHSRCSMPFNEQRDWQPTRLIDIGRNGDDQWKLCTLPLPGGPVRYMTLSYRWGSRIGMRLLKHNVNSLHQGLHISRLPWTFQDAITIARRFSIQYLWIDALCIIQDSDTDWEREAPTMRYVYSHSACNIAASAAIDQDSGIFRPRRENELLPGIVIYPSSHENNPGQSYLLFDKGYWDRQLEGPLHNRGWVFQECLLAPRVLYFTENQVLYECFHETKCEGFPQGIPYHQRSKDLSVLWDSIDTHVRKLPLVKSGKMSFQMHVLWNHLLERYTYKTLTYSKDRLPGLSGVAQLFGTVTGDEYLLGLWRSRFIEQLVWRVSQPRPKPALEHDMPSWSWASTDGGIQPMGLPSNRRNLIATNDIESLAASRLLSNPASWGPLRLTGALSVLGEEQSIDYSYNHMGSKALDAQSSPDNLEVDLSTLKEIYFLPVLTFHPWHPPQPSATRVVGLVLAPVGDIRSAMFKRIALFTTESLEDIKRLGFSIDTKGLATPQMKRRLAELAII